jgi:hypothetical protein
MNTDLQTAARIFVRNNIMIFSYLQPSSKLLGLIHVRKTKLAKSLKSVVRPQS